MWGGDRKPQEAVQRPVESSKQGAGDRSPSRALAGLYGVPWVTTNPTLGTAISHLIGLVEALVTKGALNDG